MNDGLIVIDTPEGIEAFRLLAIRSRLKLEMQGLRFRVSTFGYVRREFGFTGNRKKVFAAYEQMLRDRGVLS
jgi:hypothetical protein